MQSGDGNLCMGLFKCLPPRSFFSPFANLHKPGGERPKTRLRFDCTAAQKHLFFPFGDAASDNFRIMIMNNLARITDEPGQVVSRRDLLRDGFSAFAAIVHKKSLVFKEPCTSVE